MYWVYDDSPHPAGRDVVTAPYWLSAWMIRRGTVKVTYGDRILMGKAGDWVFPPLGRRRQTFSDNASILSVNFSAYWPSQHDLWKKDTAVVIPAGRVPELEKYARRLLKALPQPDGTIFRVMGQSATFSRHAQITHCFYDWLEAYINALTAAGCVLQKAAAADERVDLAASLINTHPFKLTFREETVAHQVGLSVRQLNRLFQDHLGTSPARYFESRRLRHARELLVNGSMPIKELSYELGFGSIAYFSHWFRKRCGEPPTSFRKAQRT